MAKAAAPAPAAVKTSDGVEDWLRPCFAFLLLAFVIKEGHVILTKAYTIRLHAIETYGYIIHEFDPYFNFRATQYLYDNGWQKFATWFDYKVWYPLGRPVGTTIYPGMQVTAVWLTKVWLPFWFGLKDWIGTSIPSNVVTMNGWEVSKSLSSSGSNVRAMLASSMAGVGVKWIDMSLNDVCCLIPAWFGSLATFITGMLALECSANFGYNEGSRFGSVLDGFPLIGVYIQKISRPIRHILMRYLGMDITSDNRPSSQRSSLQTVSLLSMLATMYFISTIPAHIMRSVGGGYDNESVAMAAMTGVFYSWTRSLRGASRGGYFNDAPESDNVGIIIRQKQDVGFSVSSETLSSALCGACAGLAYFYMVAAWGGYVFAINLIGAHAGLLVLLGRHSSKTHAAYSAFYLVGTALATRVPVVGLTPMKSLEQLGPFIVFLGLNLVEYCERVRTRDNLGKREIWLLRIRTFSVFGIVGAGVVFLLWPTGYFGPISSRVRGLFMKHTKTGNPLVDSVAEHQAAKPGTYDQYLNIVAKLAPFGFGMVGIGFCNDSSSFLLVYAICAYFFSHKMVRLILLTAPIASVLSGMLVGRIAAWCIEGVLGWNLDVWEIFRFFANGGQDTMSRSEPRLVEAKLVLDRKNSDSWKGKIEQSESPKKSNGIFSIVETGASSSIRTNAVFRLLIRGIWLYFSYFLYNQCEPRMESFQNTCWEMAKAMSHPSILFQGQRQDGTMVLVDDYREAYWWLRDNTPEDARIMAWWDYGYQITAIANRTTIADGNTWNHEHIALLGRALVGPLKEGHRIARHLADYVLLWTGGGGDDLAKSPHLARIANSVYRDTCPGDPTCAKFSMPGGQPSRMMARSLLFNLHSNGIAPAAEVDKNRFKEVYNSKHGKVRIYRVMSVSKESKEWVSNNRVCDVSGGWFCRGQYPPGLQKVLKDRKAFKQLEDFNAKTEADDEYQRKYFEHLNDPEKARRRASKKASKENSASSAPLTKSAIREINQVWEDTEATSLLYEMIVSRQIEELSMLLQDQPEYAHVRSKDGRGPMWWAHEHGRPYIIQLLKKHGVSETLRDRDGISPLDLKDDEF